MSVSKILIIGNYVAGNLGDDAILGGILTELSLLGFNGSIGILGGELKTSSEIYKKISRAKLFPSGLRSHLNFFEKAKTKRALDWADLVILGGGGLMVDEESLKAPWIWASQARAVRKKGKPYLCYGQSIGPLHKAWNQELAEEFFKNAKGVHVRDAASQEWLEKRGIESSLGTDPAWAWLSNQSSKHGKSKILLISLRTWADHSKESWASILEASQEFCSEHSFKPVLLSMEPLNSKEQEELNALGMELLSLDSAQSTFRAMQNASLAITMRLHAGIFAMAAGLPTLAMSYSSKVKDQFESLHAEGGLSVLPSKASKDEIKRHLEKLHQEGRPIFNIEKLMNLNLAFLTKMLANP